MRMRAKATNEGLTVEVMNEGTTIMVDEGITTMVDKGEGDHSNVKVTRWQGCLNRFNQTIKSQIKLN